MVSLARTGRNRGGTPRRGTVGECEKETADTVVETSKDEGTGVEVLRWTRGDEVDLRIRPSEGG